MSTDLQFRCSHESPVTREFSATSAGFWRGSRSHSQGIAPLVVPARSIDRTATESWFNLAKDGAANNCQKLARRMKLNSHPKAVGIKTQGRLGVGSF